MRIAINAAIINNKRILLLRKRQTWILPGGKPNPGESETDCLEREVKEELSGAELINPRFYRALQGRTPHTGDILEARVYFANTSK